MTGGAGFIGAALVRRLLHDGHRVRVLDNQSRGSAEGSAARLGDVGDRIEFVDADVRDADAVLRAARGVDSLCHLAAVNGTESFYRNPDLVLEVGVKGVVNTMDACLHHGIGEFVQASSSEAYQTPPAIPTPETVPLSVPDPLNPRYAYGGGMIVSELMALNYGRNRLKRVLVVRPHNVYGPDMGVEHVIPQFVLRAAAPAAAHPDGAIRFPIQGDGSQTRAFVHIDDFIAGLVTVLEKGAHRNIYHVGNDDEVTVRRLAELIFERLGRDFEIVPGALTAGQPPQKVPRPRQARGPRLPAAHCASRRAGRHGRLVPRQPAAKPVGELRLSRFDGVSRIPTPSGPGTPAETGAGGRCRLHPLLRGCSAARPRWTAARYRRIHRRIALAMARPCRAVAAMPTRGGGGSGARVPSA